MKKLITIYLLFAVCAALFSVCLSETFATAGYVHASGRLCEAQSGDHGKIYGGEPGDQSGGELKLKNYYYSESPEYRHWKFVIRCTDPDKADIAAAFVKGICKNNNIGYSNYVNDQDGIDHRNDLCIEAAKVGFDPSLIETKVDTSCTPLCLSGFCAAGIDMTYRLTATYTCKKSGTFTGVYRCNTVNAESLQEAIELVNQNYKRIGRKAPFKIIRMTPAQFRDPQQYLKRGDVLCTGHHTVILL